EEHPQREQAAGGQGDEATAVGIAAQHGGGDAQRGVLAGTGGKAGGHVGSESRMDSGRGASAGGGSAALFRSRPVPGADGTPHRGGDAQSGVQAGAGGKAGGHAGSESRMESGRGASAGGGSAALCRSMPVPDAVGASHGVRGRGKEKGHALAGMAFLPVPAVQ